MPKTVVVGLWSRPVEGKYSSLTKTLEGVETCLNKVSEFAKEQEVNCQAGTISAIFVAPEFLFTNPITAKDHKNNSQAMGKEQRNYVMDTLKEYSASRPGMLIVPGTFVFKEDPLKLHPEKQIPYGDLAIRNLQNAGQPKSVTDRGRLDRDPLKAKDPPIAHFTKEAERWVGKEKSTDAKASKAIYDEQIGRIEYLEAQERNQVIRQPTQADTYLIKNRTYVFMDGRKKFTYGKKCNNDDFKDGPDFSEGIFVPGRKEGIGRIDDKRIGFEICYDHECGILKKYVTDPLDLHIILSANVNGNDANFAVKKGGYVIHASSNSLFTGVAQRVNDPREARDVKGQYGVAGSIAGGVQLKKTAGAGDNKSQKSEAKNPFVVFQDVTLLEKEKVEGPQGQVFNKYTGNVDPIWPSKSRISKDFNAIDPKVQEIDVDGGPLRLYVIELPD